MKKLHIKGIVIGGIVDTVSTSILGSVFLLFVMNGIDVRHMSNSQFHDAAIAVIHGNLSYLVIKFLIGSMCSIWGGYIAAKIAKHDALLNGAFSSFLCVGMGLFSLLSEASLMTLADLFIAPLLGLFGGYLYLKRTSFIG